MPVQTDGSWDVLQDWPLIGIHAIVTQDGKVLTFGSNGHGMQGGQFIYDVYDPVTGEHTTLPNMTPTDIFCSAAIIIPGTSQILIGGGDARPLGSTNAGVDDVNVFDSTDLSLTAYDLGNMNFERWYPSMVSLASGQIVILGGIDSDYVGIATPEIFTPGEGWRALDGAIDTDLAEAYPYPRTFVSASGEIIYFATSQGTTGQIEVRSLDPSGDGELTTLGVLPFSTYWDSPAIMYEAGKVLIQAIDNSMWIMDITGATPVFTQTTSLDQERNWSNMSVLADGTVLINGGTSTGDTEQGADKRAAIWDPQTGLVSYGASEDAPRLYHSTSVLLADGTVLSLGGGAAGMHHNYINGQIYRPPYLYDGDGNLADRPVVNLAPSSVLPGETFQITVDDAASITRLTFVKNAATTHAFNMEARMVELDFTVGPGNTIMVTLPENPHVVGAGSWMLFAWDDQGVPSVAPIIAVQPTLANFDGTGDLIAEYFAIDPSVASLDQIDFDATPEYVARDIEISQDTGGAFHDGGSTDHFAVSWNGPFNTASHGMYTFHLTSNDGARLYIDGMLIIDNVAAPSGTEGSASVALTAGRHDIRVLYFDGSGNAVVDLDWAGPGFTRQQMRFDGAQHNVLTNGSLEAPDVGDGQAALVDRIGGWRSTDLFDVRGEGADGVAAAWGNTYLEVGAAGEMVSQGVRTVAGGLYDLAFDFSAIPGQAVSSSLEVYWNLRFVASVGPGIDDWQTFRFQVAGSGGTDTLTFRAPGGGSVGGLIDAVVLHKSGDGPPPSGLEGNNLIEGGAGAETLLGRDGDDTIVGGAGNDHLRGGVGADLLSGGEDDDTLWGDSAGASGGLADSDDTLSGDDGNDWLYGEGGDDVLDGGAGADRLYGGVGADTLVGGAGADVIYGEAGDDSLDGGEGNDVLIGGGNLGIEYLSGGAGNDLIDGQGGADRIDGGTGVDTLYGGAGNDTISGGDDDDRLYGQGGDDLLEGGTGNDRIYGEDGRDSLHGGAGDDLLYGEDGDDTIHGDFAGGAGVGAEGSDWLVSGAGDDILFGEGGNDWLLGQDDNDSLDGGTGDDHLRGGAGIDTLEGGVGDDTLWGDHAGASGLGAADILSGGAGNDYLYGEGGNDTVAGGSGFDRLYGGLDADHLSGGGDDDYLYGEAGDDMLLGDAGADWLIGGAGLDELRGGGGSDSLSGGDGDDTLWGDHAGAGGASAADAAADVLLGGAGNDYLHGEDGDDRLSGDAGFDRLYGGTGNDRLSGGDDDDYLYGEAGNDTLAGENGSDWLVGEGGNDSLDGGAGDDFLWGGDGADVMSGGAGADRFIFRGNFGADTIADLAVGDLIDIRTLGANYADLSFTATAGGLQISSNVFGPGDAILVANENGTTLAEGWFLI